MGSSSPILSRKKFIMKIALGLAFCCLFAVVSCRVPAPFQTKEVAAQDIDKCVVCTEVLDHLNFKDLIALVDLVIWYHEDICVPHSWMLLCDKLDASLVKLLKMLRLLLNADTDPHLICSLAHFC